MNEGTSGATLPGDLYAQKVRRLDHLAAGLGAVMVSYLEQAGEEAELPVLTWTVRFDSHASHGVTVENSCGIEGWCDVEGAEGVALCQQWVRVADWLDSYWSEPETDDAGEWTASGYLGGVDVSISCVVDPVARDRAHQRREAEDERRADWIGE